MKKIEKNKTIATKVVRNIISILCVVSTILILDIWYLLDKNLTEAENKYMSEVISRVSLEVNAELNGYLSVAEGVSQSYILREFLMSVADDTEEGHGADLDAMGVAGYQEAMNELQIVADMFGDSVFRVAICSLYKDNFLTHTGERGGEHFSLTSLPYYEAVVTQRTYVSAPYDDVLSNTKIVAIAEPIFHPDDGYVMGMVTIEFSTEQISRIASATNFGNSRNTFMLDGNQNILVHTNASLVGQPASVLNYTGEIMDQEINNPTGQIFNYTKNGVPRTGGVALISEITGWTIISAIDSAEFDESIEAVVLKLVIALLVSTVLTGFFGAVTIFKSLQPMKELEDFMEQLADGNLDATIEYDEPNEIGRLAQYMNRTSATLSSYIEEIDLTMGEFERGNFVLTKSSTYKGDFQSIQKSMERFVEMMSQSLQDLNRAIQEVNQGSTQVAVGAQLLASGSTEQATSVVGLNGLIGNINETIVDTAKNSSTVTEDAQHISADLLKSNVKMQELVVSVQGIRAMSDEVKRIIKSIEEVAFQTNILSLNASVEAARAGTSGKGFAVVADEVRTLSLKTAEAAEETTKIINDIATAIETGSDLALNTSKDLQIVVDEVNVFVDKISSISLSAQDQAEAIAEINKGISEISSVVSKNSSISEESAAASEELSSQSHLMLSLVEQFKLK